MGERGAGQSDPLELRCRDGAIVRVLFALDARDREIISAETAWAAMIACSERRFGVTKAPHIGRVAIRRRTGVARRRHCSDCRGARRNPACVPAMAAAHATASRKRSGRRSSATAPVSLYVNDAETDTRLLPNAFAGYKPVPRSPTCLCSRPEKFLRHRAEIRVLAHAAKQSARPSSSW